MPLLRIIIHIVVISMLSTAVASAQKNTYQLSGYLGVKGGESFSYDIELEDSTDNILKGFAYTYLDYGKDVKAKIIGNIDRVNKTITIKETHILHNHGFKSKAVICLLESILTYNEVEKTLHGRLATKTAGSGALPCSDGSLTFIKEDEIKKLFNIKKAEVNKVDTLIKPATPTPSKPRNVVYINKDSINRARQASEPKMPTAPIKYTITDGKDKTFEWQGTNVKLEIWDGNFEDGDMVNIYVNGQIILKEYTLKNKAHTLNIDISNNELSIITIEALNNGGDPPNTANIKIWDGEKDYNIIAHNEPNKKALLKIKRKL